MNKLPLRKCPQCRQVKREDITHICQACYIANKREFNEQVARYQGTYRPPIRNRNIIAYPLFTYLPEPHEYVWYWWTHLSAQQCLALTGCILGTLFGDIVNLALFHTWLGAIISQLLALLITIFFLWNIHREEARGNTADTENSLSFPLGESGTLNPPQGGSVIALPISPYTGQPYDPAWFSETQGGGQSNTALLALMKRMEREIEERKAGIPKDEPEYAQVQAMYPESEQ